MYKQQKPYQFGDALAKFRAQHGLNDFGSDEKSAEYHALAQGTKQDNTATRVL